MRPAIVIPVNDCFGVGIAADTRRRQLFTLALRMAESGTKPTGETSGDSPLLLSRRNAGRSRNAFGPRAFERRAHHYQRRVDNHDDHEPTQHLLRVGRRQSRN